MEIERHHEKVRNSFAPRILTYDTAARWVLDEDLARLQHDLAGRPEGENKSCLDLCCGTGTVGRGLLELGWKVRGLDLTPEMAWVASQYFPVKIGSVERMPYVDHGFDLAVLRQAFMLVDGPRALAEVKRVLKPGGRFILIQSVGFSERDEEVFARVQRAAHPHLTAHHTAQDLERMLAAAGFSLVAHANLRIRESVDHWLAHLPELNKEARASIRDMIIHAPESYRSERLVEINGGELFEDWNWLALTARV